MILLTWNSFTMMTFTSHGKAMNYWQKKLSTFTIIRNKGWLIQNLHIGLLLLFDLITQIFHLFLLKATLLILLTLYNPRSFVVTLIFQLKVFCRVCFEIQSYSLSIRNYFYTKFLFFA